MKTPLLLSNLSQDTSSSKWNKAEMREAEQHGSAGPPTGSPRAHLHFLTSLRCQSYAEAKSFWVHLHYERQSHLLLAVPTANSPLGILAWMILIPLPITPTPRWSSIMPPCCPPKEQGGARHSSAQNLQWLLLDTEWIQTFQKGIQLWAGLISHLVSLQASCVSHPGRRQLPKHTFHPWTWVLFPVSPVSPLCDRMNQTHASLLQQTSTLKGRNYVSFF